MVTAVNSVRACCKSGDKQQCKNKEQWRVTQGLQLGKSGIKKKLARPLWCVCVCLMAPLKVRQPKDAPSSGLETMPKGTWLCKRHSWVGVQGTHHMNQGHTHSHQSQELRRLEAQKRHGYPPLPKGLTAWNCPCLPVRGLAHAAEDVISLLRVSWLFTSC